MKTVSPATRAIDSIARWLNIVGAGILFLLMLLTVTDVCLRYFFNRPLRGTFELTELMMVAIVVLGLAYTAASKGHIAVELLISSFNRRSRAITEAFTYLLSIGIISLIIWQSTIYALEALRLGEHSDILKVPTFYFKILVPIGTFFLALELIISTFESLRKVFSR